MNFKYAVLIFGISSIFTSSAFASTLYPVGGKIIDRKTKDYITLACTEDRTLENCDQVVMAEGHSDGSALQEIHPNARFKVDHIQEVQSAVQDYVTNRAYLQFSWTPLSDAVIKEVNKDKLPSNFHEAFVEEMGRIFIEALLLCVTYPTDILLTPIEAPREFAQIGLEHMLFPIQAKRMARLTGDLTEQDFSRKISDAKYKRLKAGLISAFSGQPNPQI